MRAIRGTMCVELAQRVMQPDTSNGEQTTALLIYLPARRAIA